MKKGRFLWSAHRITERQKAGKARSIKGKQLKNSRSTASKPLVARPSSPSADRSKITTKKAQNLGKFRFSEVFSVSSSKKQRGIRLLAGGLLGSLQILKKICVLGEYFSNSMYLYK